MQTYYLAVMIADEDGRQEAFIPITAKRKLSPKKWAKIKDEFNAATKCRLNSTPLAVKVREMFWFARMIL